jgi:hypothetical protein
VTKHSKTPTQDFVGAMHLELIWQDMLPTGLPADSQSFANSLTVTAKQLPVTAKQFACDSQSFAQRFA